jgi:hypothetical protein
MKKLNLLSLSDNRLSSLDLPSGLTALAFLNLNNNSVTNLTLPPDMQQLIGLFLDGNPLATLVLSEPLAATNLAGTVASLRSQGVSIFTYPLAIRMDAPRLTAEAFEFTLKGPPGNYTVFGSADLAAWTELGTATNIFGSTVFTDATTILSPRRFYRGALP